MKLNLHIIWDELQKYGDELVCTDEIRSRLGGVRYIESEENVLSEQFLYLTDADTLFHIPADAGRLSFVCLGLTDQAILLKRDWSAILLPANTNRHQVFRQIQEIFEEYAQWEQDILLAIANHEPLQAIFDRGSRFLRNPIALFDNSLAFIMRAGTLPANIENTIWEEVLSQGYTRIESLPPEEQRNIARLLATHDEPFFYQPPGLYSQHRQMIASLKRNGEKFGTFGMIDIVEPFTLGQLSIVSHLRNFMQLALQQDAQFASISVGASYFVERLLQGLSVERNAVDYHLAKKSWHIEDKFCLVYFTRTDNSQIDDSLNAMYAFRIRALFDEAMVFPYENGLLAIGHKHDRIRTDHHFAAELSLLLKNMDLCCGVSLVFHDFMNLKYAYIQCKTALSSPSSELKPQTYLFETQYTEHVVKALDTSTSLKSLCLPQVLRLYHTEGGKGQEFVHSLQTYLINGRNTTATAARLFIHRNTLLYRLERIEEILEIDLESADEQMLFMMYLSCLIANHIKYSEQ